MVGPVKAIKDTGKIFRGNSRAVIFNG